MINSIEIIKIYSQIKPHSERRKVEEVYKSSKDKTILKNKNSKYEWLI